MTRQMIRMVVACSLVLLMHSGCNTMQMAPETKGTSLAVAELVKTTRSWDGKSLPAYPQGQPEVTILRITIPPDSRLDTHRHPVINAGVLMSGQLTVVTTDGNTLHLKAGDPIVEVVDTWHYGMNQGKVPAEIVVFYAGIAGRPITIVEP
jgi:quercetin dioxygenase-like cupin family protein